MEIKNPRLYFIESLYQYIREALSYCNVGLPEGPVSHLCEMKGNNKPHYHVAFASIWTLDLSKNCGSSLGLSPSSPWPI
jgi:hypothetical protein